MEGESFLSRQLRRIVRAFHRVGVYSSVTGSGKLTVKEDGRPRQRAEEYKGEREQVASIDVL